MVNIFKTTLKKDIIADIVNNDKREIRFPITKFWASRFTDEYNLDEMIFNFRTYDSLELSTPSNKETFGERYVFDFVKIFVDGDEFVMEFKDADDKVESCETTEYHNSENILTENDVKSDETPKDEDDIKLEEGLNNEDDVDASDTYFDDKNDIDDENISNDDIFAVTKMFLEEERVLDTLYENEFVIATNAKQVIILPKGRVLGSNKTLPVNNDVEVRIEFDMSKKIYLDSMDFDFYIFEDAISKVLSEIRKNNFVFIWKRYTGIFMDDDGRIYFGIKYSTRKSIGFNRRYSVQ